MAKKDTTLTVNIPATLKDLLCDHFKTSNISVAIYKGLIGFLSVSSYAKRLDDFALHQLLTIKERTRMEKRSIRIPQELKVIIDGYTVINTSYNVITVMLANYLSKVLPVHNTLPAKINTADSMHIMRLLGSKWNPKMQSAINNIFQSSSNIWTTSIEPFAGALGIFSNFRIAFHEIINDLDLQKVNLYRAIKDAYDEMLLAMLCLPTTEETFEEKKNALKEGFPFNGAKPNIEAATSFLFSNLMSLRNTGYTYKAMSTERYQKRLDALAPLHSRMQNVEICGLYGLDLIKRHMKDENAIFIIDPPYLDTNVYENSIIIDKKYSDEKKKFGYTEHQQLAKLLRETHQKYGNDFIFFCRVTVTRKHDQKTKQITNFSELDSGDRHMHGRIDDLYWGYGFYYIDIPYSNDGTVERIITSFDFEGSTPYGCERGQK